MEKPQIHPRMLVSGMMCCVVGSLTYFEILKEFSAFIFKDEKEVAAFLKRTWLSYL
jgi:hypothetical protein